MTPADYIDAGLAIFANADVQPIVQAMAGVVIFGMVVRGLRGLVRG